MDAQQVEKAFQKQSAVVYNAKKGSKAKKRYVKSVGLGFKTPREATEGAYIDKKCPFTGNVTIRLDYFSRSRAHNCESIRIVL
jgi:small subunit ribosomal protein S11e